MQIQENTNSLNLDNYPNSQLNNQADIVYAGFFVRLAAYLVDILIVGIALSTLRFPMWFISLFNQDIFLLRPVLFNFSTWDIILYILSSLYFILLTYFKGATLGKYLLRIRVVSDSNSEKIPLLDVIYRETIGRYLSSLLFIGYLFIGASTDKRALHDILCNTHVVYQWINNISIKRFNNNKLK